MKVFISQPMNGKTEQEIIGQRQAAIENIHNLCKGPIEIVDSYFKDGDVVTHNKYGHIPILFLAKSIERMSEADAVYMCSGWESSRGCRIEHRVARDYGLTIIEEQW